MERRSFADDRDESNRFVGTHPLLSDVFMNGRFKQGDKAEWGMPCKIRVFLIEAAQPPEAGES